jgi:phosphotransferase system, enzyme I, PtsP
MALIGLGYRSLSMTASSIGPIKAMVLALDAGETARFLEPLLAEASGAKSLRAELRAFAESRGVPL